MNAVVNQNVNISCNLIGINGSDKKNQVFFLTKKLNLASDVKHD